MYFDTTTLDWKSGYKLMTATVVPRPIAWVVSTNPDGSVNAAPFSFFNYFSGHPPVVCLGMTTRDDGPPDSLDNLRRNGEFVINLVPEALAEAMNVTAIDFAPGVSEIDAARLRLLPCNAVRTPRIEGSPVALECRLDELKEMRGGTGFLVLAHVAGMHIADEAVLDASRCYVDTAALHLIGRMESPGGYVRTTDRFAMRVGSPTELNPTT